MTSLSDFTLNLLDGTPQPLSAYEGKVVVMVNVASKCGLTPQYEGLEAVYRQYKDRGLVILGFPCNQFAGQEPGSSAEIAEFCSLTYDVTFPVFERIDVNGEEAHPLYKWLKAEAPGLLGSEAIKWNFTKFLIGRDGKVAERYAPTTEPKDMTADIEKLL
ncbi:MULTISPECIES: glutathione peroxidase [Devosia]|uniref:Glutathione peroxidase n=1 Tax=Devosia equisanguinis TaxID=2490941 RepID=A0A447I6P7_9HYPH|nr:MULTISPECIES: glutathione peroxidase [Devosia]ODT48142.1 MAG: glutathione peroxidase [Pelagibacterium sp. SCN 63-126]ODU85406.1 MAG: glutathione peroxidase [Pelagibacterium sp. SCN 63-17]OJX42149.1 MAG: glutathione peroxidase [Devosia sp. 63-57]VDS03178.1 Hydroperoxy fatty acid reductase gpx1 [Devosia equisanguinis]